MMWHAIEPLDVLFLRGNRLFGDPGSYGEALIPPWPSVAAGAIRSAILVRDGKSVTAFGRGELAHDTLGTPEAPGAFRVTDFRLARKVDGRWQALYALPADLVVSKMDDGKTMVQRMQPNTVAKGIQSSMPTARLPVLTQARRAKPDSGWWLTEAAWGDYLQGKIPASCDLLPSHRLWQMDERVGVGIEAARGRAEDGRLFTVQAVAFREGVGFVAATEGDALRAESLLRLGGDGRGARVLPLNHYHSPQADLEAVSRAGRARIVLTAPGLFPEGWRLPGMSTEDRFALHGISGRVVCAAVGRGEVISGWDLARRHPKPAQRVAPTGSVYWVEDLDATPDALRRLANHGLWPETGYDAQRRVEGFNRFEFAAY